MDRTAAGRPFLQLRLLFLLLILRPGASQEFGDFQQLLELTVGAKLSNMLSNTCCVVRQQSCWTSARQPMTSSNTTVDLANDTKLFGQCLCGSWRQCVLRFPAGFLPSDVTGLPYDFTFVTQVVMKRYTCSYRSSRELVCQLRDAMQSGLMGWGLSALGRGGLMGLGGMVVMGEEAMEELAERMMEAGIPPRSGTQVCRRCAPLVCAAELTIEPSRSRSYYRRGRDTENTQKPRFHSCLRRHNVAPPQQTTTIRPQSHSVTTPYLPDVIINPFAWQPTTTRLSTDSTTSPTSTQDTTSQPQPPHAQTHLPHAQPQPPQTTVLPSTTTQRAAATSAATTPAPDTTLAPTSSTWSDPTTTWEEIIRYLFDISKTTTPASKGNAVNDGLSRLAPAIHSPSATPRTVLPPKRISTELTDIGRAATEGGMNEMTVAIVGVTVAGIFLTAILLLFLLWRKRRRREREKMTGIDCPAVTAIHSATGFRASVRLSKTTSLPSVSSQKNVVEDSSDEDDEKKEEGENSDTEDEERYTSEKAMGAASGTKPGNGSAVTGEHGEESETYASLDETSMLPTCQRQTSAANVISATALTWAAHSPRITQDSGMYLPMTGTTRKPEDKGNTITESEENYVNEEKGLLKTGSGENLRMSTSASSEDGYERLDASSILNGKTCGKQKTAPEPPAYLNLAPSAVNRAQMAVPRPVVSPEQHGEISDPLSATYRMESSDIYSEPYVLPATAFKSKSKDVRMTGLPDGESAESSKNGNSSDVSSDASKERVARNRDSEISTERSASSRQKFRKRLPVSSMNSDDGYLVPVSSASSQLV